MVHMYSLSMCIVSLWGYYLHSMSLLWTVDIVEESTHVV